MPSGELCEVMAIVICIVRSVLFRPDECQPWRTESQVLSPACHVSVHRPQALWLLTVSSIHAALFSLLSSCRIERVWNVREGSRSEMCGTCEKHPEATEGTTTFTPQAIERIF